jgi:hypothetical protein
MDTHFALKLNLGTLGTILTIRDLGIKNYPFSFFLSVARDFFASEKKKLKIFSITRIHN